MLAFCSNYLKNKMVFSKGKEGSYYVVCVCVCEHIVCLQSVTICSVWCVMFVVYSAHQTVFLL